MSHDSIAGGTAAISLRDDVAEALETAQLPARPDDTGLPRPVEAALRETDRTLAVSFFLHARDTQPKDVQTSVTDLFDRLKAAATRPHVNVDAANDDATKAVKERGAAFSPCRYKPNTPRGKINVEAVSCFIMDLDKCDDDGDAVFAHLESLGVCALAYTTWGSGWKEGSTRKRWRVVVPFVNDVSAEDWTGVWPMLNNALALGQSDHVKDASRLHFMPRAPRRVPDMQGGLRDNDPIEVREIQGELFDPTAIVTEARRSSARVEHRKSPPPKPSSEKRANRVKRAKLWLAKAAVSRGDGDASATLMAVLGEIIRGFDLDDSEAREAIAEWNSRCVTPEGTPWPWSDADLDRAIGNVQQSHDPQGRPRGWKLDERKPRNPLDKVKSDLARRGATQGAVQRTLDGNEEPTNKPTIRCDADLPGMVSQVLGLLERAPHVYQRSGSLVVLSTSPATSPHERRRIDRPEGSMTIKGLTEGYARELLCELATWTKPKKVDGDWIDAPTIPPIEVVRALLAPRPHLGGVRVLTGFVEAPCIRPDGSLLTAPGYDVMTGLYHHRSIDNIVVPDAPTHDDAKQAVARLLDVVSDFPFEQDCHKAAWVAGVLTTFARHAIDGPVPLFFVEAPQKGSGKSLLARSMSWIARGRDPAMSVWTNNDDEFRKRMLATGRGGDPLILIDNVSGLFGGPTLDAILTNNGEFQDRVLGTNYNESVRIVATWVATGNNATLTGDVDRRIVPIRLDPKDESPELRDDFKHPDLQTHVHKHRAELVSAALTILRAYILAGRPPQQSQAWGSYEKWRALVVGAVVWSGLADPGEGREALKNRDPRTQGLDELLDLWPHIDDVKDEATKQANGLRARDLVALCNPLPRSSDSDGESSESSEVTKRHGHTQKRARLVAALENLGCRNVLNNQLVGEALARIRGRTRPFEVTEGGVTKRGSHRLTCRNDRNKVAVWYREVVKDPQPPQ